MSNPKKISGRRWRPSRPRKAASSSPCGIKLFVAGHVQLRIRVLGLGLEFDGCGAFESEGTLARNLEPFLAVGTLHRAYLILRCLLL